MKETVGERILYSTVLVEALLTSGKTTTATAFFYRSPIHPAEGYVVVLLVSNKHVLSDSVAITVYLHSGSVHAPNPGYKHKITINRPYEVIDHPDPHVDVAAINISGIIQEIARTSYFTLIDAHQGLDVVSDANVVGAIEQIRFVGYPLGIFDSANLLPIVRSGHTASPLLNDYEGKEAFLIDASVFPGSSGSPVFILDISGIYQTRDGVSHAGSRCIFLGVLAAFQTRQVSGKVVRLPASTMVKSEESLDLGLVFKSSTVASLAEIAKTKPASIGLYHP